MDYTTCYCRSRQCSPLTVLLQEQESTRLLEANFQKALVLAEREGFEPSRLAPTRFRVGRTRPDYAISPGEIIPKVLSR